MATRSSFSLRLGARLAQALWQMRAALRSWAAPSRLAPMPVLVPIPVRIERRPTDAALRRLPRRR